MTPEQTLFLEGYCFIGAAGLAAGVLIAWVWLEKKIASLKSQLHRAKENNLHLSRTVKVQADRLSKFDARQQPRDKNGWFVRRKKA